MKIVVANSQMFQALYIDTDAKEDKDKIVLIEEMVESLPEAQQILTSMMKEPYYGMVISGSNIAIAKFRSEVHKIDSENNLGSQEIGDILAALAEAAYSKQCEVEFFKGPVEHKGIPEQMKNVSVAIDLKNLFDTSKIKESGKEFWKNLIGVDKELEKKYNKLNLKEHKKLMDYLDANEQNVEKLKEAIKDQGTKIPNIENMLDDAEFDEIEEYLGPTYSNLKYYEIDLPAFQKATKTEPPAPPKEGAAPAKEFPYDNEDEDGNTSPSKPAAKDPRTHLIELLTASDGAIKTRNGTVMSKSNIIDAGINRSHLVLALKKPEDYDLNWWPKQPSKGTKNLIERYDWIKNPKDDQKKNDSGNK